MEELQRQLVLRHGRVLACLLRRDLNVEDRLPQPVRLSVRAVERLWLQPLIAVLYELLCPALPDDPELPRQIIELPDALNDHPDHPRVGPVSRLCGVLAAPAGRLLQRCNGRGRRHAGARRAVIDVRVSRCPLELLDLVLQNGDIIAVEHVDLDLL